MAKSLHATAKMEHSHESAKDCFHLIIIYLSSSKRLLKLKVPSLPVLPWFSGGAAQETLWDALGRRQDTSEGNVLG